MGFKNHYYKCLKEISEKYTLRHTPARLRSLVSFYTIYSFLGEHEDQLERIDKIIKKLFVSTQRSIKKDNKEYDWQSAAG